MIIDKDQIDPEILALMYGYAGRDLFERKQVTEAAFDEMAETEWKLADFMSDLQNAIASIPEQYRDAARVELLGHWDETRGQLVIKYERDETDTEIDERIKSAWAYARGRQQKEHAEYERLKAKFGA